jgi:hypothetical protein
MEALNESNTDNMKEGFFKYVFDFDDDNKNLLLNLFQYSFIAVPFIIIVLKLMNHYTPEDDDNKGTLEILVEIIASLSGILLSIWFINRIIRYIPTYSKTDYASFNETNFILPLLIVLFTMQTKLGAKINILVERLVDLYDGKTNLKNNAKKNDYKTTQPISQVAVHQPSQADFMNQQQQQHTNNLTTNQYVNTAHQQQQQQQQQQPDFNNAYQGPSNPLMNAMEPMAANEAMGGMFGSLF